MYARIRRVVTVPSMAAARLRAMPAVTVRIMHPEPGPEAGPLESWVAAARARLARHHAERFAAAGAGDVGIVAGPPDGLAFGARVRSIVAADRPAGLVLLGSGAIPLATRRDVRDLVDAAAADDRVALTNNRYSADAIAISHATDVLARPAGPPVRQRAPALACRGGRLRRCATCDVDGGSASTSTARWISC